MSDTRKPNRFFKPFVVILILLSSLAYFASCYQAPVTGRSQFILIPESQEIQIGLTAFQEALKKSELSDNRAYNGALTRVSTRLARVADKPSYNWEYRVFKGDDTINAFAVPGGKIGVFTGIFPIAKNDAGLATVVGHEIAHSTARHGGERISAGILAELGAAGLGVALRNREPGAVNAIMQAYGLGVTVGALLPFSRAQESEADRIGLIYMARAGYDPREALAFWYRMDEATRGKPRPPQFLAIHPSHGARINNLKRWMPEALYHYQRAIKAPNNVIALGKE